MKEAERDLWRLSHISEAIEKIENFLSDVGSFEEFFVDQKSQSSVKYELMVIGEACNRLSENIKKEASGTQWRAITAVRNYLAHEYFGVDVHAIWEMIQKDLPQLKEAVTHLKNRK